MINRLKPLRVLLRGGRVRLACVLALSAMDGVIVALPAWALGNLVDSITTQDEAVTRAVILLAGVTAASGALPHVTGLISLSLTGRIAVSMQEQIAESMIAPVGVEHLVDAAQQEQAYRARQAANMAPRNLLDVVNSCVAAVFTIATYAGIMLRTWPWMAVLLIVTAVPLAFLQRRASRQRVRHSVDAVRADRWSRYYLDSVSDHHVGRDVRLFGAGPFLISQLRKSLERSRRLQMRAFVLNFVSQTTLVTVNALVAGAGTWVAANSVVAHHTSLGDFVLFITAVMVLQKTLTVTMTIVGTAAQSVQLVNDFHAVTAGAHQRKVPDEQPTACGDLVFDDVWFRYDEGAPWVLRGASFTLPIGQTAVIFGENGGGKSTILALALRLFAPTRGRITLGSRDIQAIDADQYRRAITGVLQDFTQFELSVRDNVLLAESHDGADQRLQDVAERGGVASLVEGLPNRWDTLLSRQREVEEGVAGTELSGGQRQKLALLRALWRSGSELVLLDEMTSALDHRAEIEALDAIVERFPHASKLVVSHRPAAGRYAHRVLFVRAGNVSQVWEGSPGEFDLERFEQLWLDGALQQS